MLEDKIEESEEEFVLESYDLYIKNINFSDKKNKNEDYESFRLMDERNQKINLALFQDIDFLLKGLNHFQENKIQAVVNFYDLENEKDDELLMHKVANFKVQLANDLTEEEKTHLLKNVRFEHQFLKYAYDEFKTKKLKTPEELSEIRKDIVFINKIKNSIIKNNLKLVIKIAKNYKSNNLDFLDLIQEGNIGLIKGVDKFKYQMGYKLSTYVSWWIKQAIVDSLTKKSRTIKLPNNIVNVLFKIKRMEAKERISRYHLTPEQLAKKINAPLEKVLKALEAPEDIISTENVIGDSNEKDVFFGDLMQADESYEPDHSLFLSERREEFLKIIKDVLSEREQFIVAKRFGLEKGREQTLEEVGNFMGLTKERVRQIEAEAINKLKGISLFKQFALN